MNVILYMATSANGLIATRDDDTSWVSPAEWNSYSQAVRAAGNLIVGHRTYTILTQQPEFSEFKEVRIVVVAHENFPTLSPNHFVAHSPAAALELLSSFKKIIVAGDGALNASFLEENLVDEIYLDIEPIILGAGIPLCKDKNFARNLKLLGQKQISDNEVQLHYAILK